MTDTELDDEAYGESLDEPLDVREVEPEITTGAYLDAIYRYMKWGRR